MLFKQFIDIDARQQRVWDVPWDVARELDQRVESEPTPGRDR